MQKYNPIFKYDIAKSQNYLINEICPLPDSNTNGRTGMFLENINFLKL